MSADANDKSTDALMTLRFTLTLDDFVQAAVPPRGSRGSGAALVVIALFMGVYALKAFVWGRETVFGLGQMVAAVWLGTIGLQIMFGKPAQLRWAQQVYEHWTRVPGEVEVQLTERGIHFRYPCAECRFDWSLYTTLRLTRDVLVLERGIEFDLLPKRVFETTEAYETFVGIFSNKTGGLIEPERRGFAVVHKE